MSQPEGLNIHRRGRELARDRFIEPTVANGGRMPDEVITEISVAARTTGMGMSGLVGIIISLSEEAAGILTARRLESARSRALEEKLVRAEVTIRNLMDRAERHARPGLENGENDGGIIGGNVRLDPT